jgi:hypothetical protein
MELSDAPGSDDALYGLEEESEKRWAAMRSKWLSIRRTWLEDC